MKFGLEDRHWLFIELKLISPLKDAGAKVWVFGSRAKGTHKKFSDLDVLYEPSKPLPQHLITKINNLLEDSNLPIKVDLVAIADLAESYRPDVLRSRVEV